MGELFPYTRNTEASPPPATQSDALFDWRDGLFDWVEVAGAQIRRSAWSEALRIDDVDAWDAASTALAISLLGLSRRVRNGGRPSARPRIVRAIHQFAANTYRATLGGPWPFVRRLDPRADLLFWPVEPTHVAAQVPVIRAARSFGSMVEIVVCRRQAESLIAATGVGPATFLPSQYLAAYRRGLRVGGRRARALWSDPGVKFPELEPGVAREDLITCLRRALQPAVEVVNWVVAVHHELARDCPDAVFVVGNDLTVVGRTLALCQSARSRPSASLMHGVLGSRRQHARHIVDRFLVYGEVQRRALVAAGLSEKKIAVCGAPLMEAQRGRTRTNRHPSARKLGLVDDRPFVLLATSGPGNSISLEHHLDVIRAVAQLSVIMPEVQFVVRKHRKDRRHLYTTICDSIPGNRLVVPLDDVISATSIFDWLQACQMVITGGSAVAVDAMFAGVPVVTLDLRNELEGVDFIRAGATRHVRSRAELERVVRDTLRSPAKPELDRHVQEFLEQNYLFPEEGAATRCARTLRELGTVQGGVPLPGDGV